MTATDKLPLEGTFSEALKIYSSRLRTFGEVALYTGSILALLAYPLLVHAKQGKVLYFLLFLAFVTFHGLPILVNRILREGVSEELDTARLVADLATTYGILQEYVLNRTPERRIQETVKKIIEQFPGQVRLEKHYSVIHESEPASTSVLVLQERLMRSDMPISNWVTTMVRVKSGNLDDNSILRLVQEISSFGAMFPPDKTTINRPEAIKNT